MLLTRISRRSQRKMKTILQRINNSSGLWALMNDNTIPHNIHASLGNIQQSTVKALHFADNLDKLMSDIKEGEGSIGSLIRDTLFIANLNNAVMEMKSVGTEADSLVNEMGEILDAIRYDINEGQGPVNALLNDSSIMAKFNASLDNIQSGTDRFNQNMEAMKHNFLFRGYFKKEEKAKEKEAKAKEKAEEKAKVEEAKAEEKAN